MRCIQKIKRLILIGRIYQLNEHIARLLTNARALNMTPVESADELQQISQRLVHETVGPPHHDTPSAIVYYQLSPGHYGTALSLYIYMHHTRH